MDAPHKSSPETREIKNTLPDVVHSQHIPTVGNITTATGTDTQTSGVTTENQISNDESQTESISEHIPSKIEYSTDSDNDTKAQDCFKATPETDKLSTNCAIKIQVPLSPTSDNPSEPEASKASSLLPLDVNAVSDIQLLSEESPVNLALSSEKSQLSDEQSQNSHHSTPVESQRSNKYLHSPNEELNKSLDLSLQNVDNPDSPEKFSSGSEDVIKIDIRGQGVPKFPFQSAKIIFGPPPEGATIIEANDSNVEQIPVFPNLLSPFLIGAGDSSVQVEEVFDYQEQPKVHLPESLPKSPGERSLSSEKSSLSSDKPSESDKLEANLLIEEITVEDETKEKNQDETAMPKSIPVEDTMSFSTLTTDYKTICEEYHVKLVHLEAAITQRDELIEELTVSLQRSVQERDDLRYENAHLANEVSNLQHMVAERPHSENDTVKGQISDFVKYQSLLKDDSTKYYSAVLSGGSSLQSSNGEKDMDREEIVINHSKSDFVSSDISDEFQTGLEKKLTTIINKFESYLEENLRNKLRESLIQVLCNEFGKMRIDCDTEIKELEAQMQQGKQAYSVETRRLRELLASVKAGNADIEELRHELDVKHEKEMENLRTYFEKKCSDMERSYSEEVWRGKCSTTLGSASSLDADVAAAGDCLRRRTRSAELPSLALESTQLEQALKQACKKYEQQIDELKGEHVAYVNELQATHREAIAALDEQITQLKAHIQTAENTEQNVSLYQQDIDLELEKKMEAQLEERLEEVRDEVRQEVVIHLQEQLQVLLSDPDAEVSNWPLELVALRDKIYGDTIKTQQEKECSSLRDELSVSEDKWRQRRNFSFDQNRQLEEVTRERDDLRRLALSLHGVVAQLAAYCASAEDELNRTVLAELFARLLPDNTQSILEDESRPTSPNLSANLNTSLVTRSGKHVHFAPDLNVLLADLDEEGIVKFLQEQRDLSADIKKELEHSLRRLRHEAHSLLDLSDKFAHKNRPDCKMLESSQVQITELVHDLEDKQKSCDNCELHRKNMEEAMAECLQRENLLRSDLEAAMIKIAQLMSSADVIAEGYGTGPQSGAVCPRSRPTPTFHSLDGTSSPRVLRLAHDIDSLQKERDDLHQQLEAANRQLRSTRQFVEEQATEREAERDEFVRRLADLRDENSRLSTRLQNNARILNEVEQLETQTREMNQIIAELEARKASTDEELKSCEEKTTLLRDIIANLESQLEQKTTHEIEILEQLEQMKQTIDDRDAKMRALLGELESMKSEKLEQSNVTCVQCGHEEEKTAELLDRIKQQCQYLEEHIHRRTQRLERVHEVCSATCSEPSEDVSLREQRTRRLQMKSPDTEASPRVAEHLSELAGVWDCLQTHARAEDAALKRIADLDMQRAKLKDIAQEVRAERDVLQARMSEQALKISSLSARLQQQRNDAEALSHHAAGQLSVQLHDALAEVQRLKEELESKDKQLTRVKQNLEEKDKLNEEHHSLYGNSCNPKDKVIILERELSTAQTRIAQLECIAKSLEKDKEELKATVRDLHRELAEKEDQLQQLLALKLEEDIQKQDRNDVLEGKASARTLSDIVSISEFDEHDLQMRRAELKGHNVSLTGVPYPEIKETTINRIFPADFDKANMSSLNIEHVDHFDLPGYTPRADSLPAHLTSTQNKDFLKEYKRNVNETTMFGVETKHAQTIPDNCSMYPNREISDSKDIDVQPKKINFSLENTDNKTHDEFTSLRELGITLDVKQENFPDILTQLKYEIKKSKTELENTKSELKNAEEQLCEFPALKEEVEELKNLLENTMATMENDKKFYENQLENFSSNKNLLEQRLSDLAQEVSDKSKDLHLLKEDILRRENMILELAKEKRNLTNKMTELEVKIDELKSRNNTLDKYESECHQMREKLNELHKLEQLVSEKNQQIDSLNQHLDRLDDLQRNLNDKTEELDNLKEALEEKSNELFQLRRTMEALNHDLAKAHEENDKLNSHTKDLNLKLTKLEKEQENASLRLQSNECELERVNTLNNELTAKIDELKTLTDKLKDKETEIEILHEDINGFHEEIACLKEQLKMVSRSPSPRSKNGEERKSLDRQMSSDKKQLVKIRKQISLLQHELDFNKKELNDKAFELAKAKLDVTELKNNLSQANKQIADRDIDNKELKQQTEQLQEEIRALTDEKQHLGQQLETVIARMREESNISELKNKLRQKAERCQELEIELENMRELVDRVGGSPRAEPDRALAVRSPTAELERALRDQLDYSHTLDDDIMEQIFSASSDEREDIPHLALNTSKSSSSIHSSSSDRINRLRSDNEKLQLQVNNLELRLKDKDALITELNRVRDKLMSDSQTYKLKYEAERDNCGRLQLLLDTHKETSESLQNQDSNMIQILKKRLESSMASEFELQRREQEARARFGQLERQLLDSTADNHQDPLRAQLNSQIECSERLKGEVSLLKSKLEVERGRYGDLQAMLDHSRLHAQREIDAKSELCTALKNQLAEIKRQKHDTGVQLLRAKELIGTQSSTIAELEAKLSAVAAQRPLNDALTEIESTKSELTRELAILKKCLSDSGNSELVSLRQEKQQLAARVETLEKEAQARLQHQPDENDQALRYLHGRCLRLESCRKALVWQKRYLQRVIAGYTEFEKNLRLPSLRAPELSHGKKRFKCIATVVVIVLRMGFLVRRRQHVRALSSSCLLRTNRDENLTRNTNVNSTAYVSAYAGNSPPSRDIPAGAPGAQAGGSTARRPARPDLRLQLSASPLAPASPLLIRRVPYTSNSPRGEPFILSSPRADVAAAYLNKLELVSRCLNHAMESPRDVP